MQKTPELSLLGISTLAAANGALPMLIRKHNEQFLVVPREGEFAYLPLPSTTELEHVFTTRYSRKIGLGNMLSFEGKKYTFAHPSSLRLGNKTVVEVRKTFKGEVFVWHQGKLLALKKTACPVQRRSQRKKEKVGSMLPHKPAEGHPWRRPWNPKPTTS